MKYDVHLTLTLEHYSVEADSPHAAEAQAHANLGAALKAYRKLTGNEIEFNPERSSFHVHEI